ncbi:hypothetical protein AB7783_11725 [Tardiphaga sp. 172_B4_N1_3]|uniref:hypothetical protein n=1 Tax=Tardiphaga sp. 172_B4_N1_3 TaxID=3240787 RepID=UPI003F8929C7
MTKTPAAKVNSHIEDYFEERARAGDGAFAIAYALIELKNAQMQTARALNKLGVADASTPFGAIEHLAKEVKDAGQAIAEMGSVIADAISQSSED